MEEFVLCTTVDHLQKRVTKLDVAFKLLKTSVELPKKEKPKRDASNEKPRAVNIL